VVVLRDEGAEVTVLFSSPREWWPISDSATLSADEVTKDLIVSDTRIGRKRAAFILAGMGIVMDVSSDRSRWRTDQAAVPPGKPLLGVAVPAVVAVLDAWHERNRETLVARATYPFVASFDIRNHKRICHSEPLAITARNADDLRKQISVLFGHPFRRESVLGRVMDPRYAAWRAYEPYQSPKESSSGRARRDVAYVQVELFDLPRGIDALFTIEVVSPGIVQRLSYEDFVWAEKIERQCNRD
jgi:hypothetical protein